MSARFREFPRSDILRKSLLKMTSFTRNHELRHCQVLIFTCASTRAWRLRKAGIVYIFYYISIERGPDELSPRFYSPTISNHSPRRGASLRIDTHHLDPGQPQYIQRWNSLPDELFLVTYMNAFVKVDVCEYPSHFLDEFFYTAKRHQAPITGYLAAFRHLTSSVSD